MDDSDSVGPTYPAQNAGYMGHPHEYSGLAGKRVLITGGARRIGRALVMACAEAGAHVALTYRDSQAEAEETLRALPERGGVGMALRMDVRDPESVREAVNAVAEEFDGLDILINNAGSFEKAALEDLSIAQWDAMQQTNARGPFLVSQAAHPHLKKSGGRIVNLGSLGGAHAWVTHPHYCVSKAALHMLTAVMAKAWAPEIAVNCVAPGMIYDDATRTHASYERFAEKTPMRRNGTMDDVAAAVLFFATAPSFITGQILFVDGGLGL
jgi:NAD(P)-dependent dehydrogenase (short-subunit alcohol dehydrogenase family)